MNSIIIKGLGSDYLTNGLQTTPSAVRDPIGPVFKPRLPNTGVDKDQILDSNGNIYQYSSETECWAEIGQVVVPDPVSIENDGIVTSNLFKKLELIKKLVDGGADFSLFKLQYKTDKPPYYFYFHSSDDSIRFYPESQNELRIEVDQGRLYQKLLRGCCKGPKGPKGDQGEPGLDGEPAADELPKQPSSVVDDTFVFSSIVNLPIDTPVSFRIFEEDQILEAIVPLDGSEIILTLDSSVEIEESATEFNISTGTDDTATISGQIKFLSGTTQINSWYYKVRQRGPKGETGNPGFGFFELQTQIVDDLNIRSSNAIISVRKSNLNNNIFFLQQPIFEEICVSNIKATQSTEPFSNDINQVKFAGVEVTTKDCKYVGTHTYKTTITSIGVDTTPPEIEFPAWSPTGDCVLPHRYHQYKFEWYNNVERRYPYKIATTPSPPEQCCAEDFFFCPNIGDNPCGIEGVVPAPVPQMFDDCGCDSPIADQIQGDGVNIGNMDFCVPCISEDGTSCNATIAFLGCINGAVNPFRGTMEVCGICEFKVVINRDSSTFSGGSLEEESSSFYIDDDQVHSTIVITSRLGTSTITDGGRAEVDTLPSSTTFFIETVGTPPDCVKDVLDIQVNVNDLNANYCYGYQIIFTGVSTCEGEEVPPSPPTTPPAPPAPPPTPPAPPTSPPSPPSSGSEPVEIPVDFLPEGELVTGSLDLEEARILEISYEESLADWSASNDQIISLSIDNVKNATIIRSPQDLISDQVLSESSLAFDDILIDVFNAALQNEGPYGSGAYFPKSTTFNTYLFLKTRTQPVRIDTWTNIIVYVSNLEDGQRQVYITARLKSAQVEFASGSTMLTRLSSFSGTGGTITALYQTFSQDPILAYNNGSNSVMTQGVINVAYGEPITYPTFEGARTGLPGESAVTPCTEYNLQLEFDSVVSETAFWEQNFASFGSGTAQLSNQSFPAVPSTAGSGAGPIHGNTVATQTSTINIENLSTQIPNDADTINMYIYIHAGTNGKVVTGTLLINGSSAGSFSHDTNTLGSGWQQVTATGSYSLNDVNSAQIIITSDDGSVDIEISQLYLAVLSSC